MVDKHPCEGCRLFEDLFGLTMCNAGLPRKRNDGKCFVPKPEARCKHLTEFDLCDGEDHCPVIGTWDCNEYKSD